MYSPEQYVGIKDESFRIIIASSYQDEMIRQLCEFGYKIGEHIIIAIDLKKELSEYGYADRTGLRRLSIQEKSNASLRYLKILTKYARRTD